MKILAIETSCDETAAAVTEGAKVLASVKWTQEVHAKYGGVVPALAKRAHEERIDQIIEQALFKAKTQVGEIKAIAVTAGPGLAIALEVGVKKAKELAEMYDKPLIPVNHIEGHILSAMAGQEGEREGAELRLPCAALVISGGHTQVIWVEKIGKYKILAESLDDDIGEALDKGARMLGLPYPGGPELEKLAAKGDPKRYMLPLPMARRKVKAFSYSGLKTAMYRLVETTKGGNRDLGEKEKSDLAASYQARVFEHLTRITRNVLGEMKGGISELLVGGGVAANTKLRGELETLGRELSIKVHYPENTVLCTDNAAMIGVAAGYKFSRGEYLTGQEIEKIDRRPRWRVDSGESF